MPQATGLNFYRKRQTLDSLACERPKNLPSVYAIVKEVVKVVEDRLVNLETSYYGPTGGLEAEVKQWQLSLQVILRSSSYSGLICMKQLNEMHDRNNDVADILTLDDESLAKVQTRVRKVLQVLREGFSESIYFVKKLLEYLKKYCVSFHPTDGDPYLETATNYEKQKRELEKAITLNLENIPLMANTFEKDALTIHHFDMTIKEIAQRLRITHSPIALVFAAACYNIRNACKGLLAWVDADAAYIEYLRYDIQEIEKMKELQCRLLREAQMKTSSLEFAAKSLKKYLLECEEQVARLQPREKALQAEEKRLRAENKDVIVDLELKERKKMEENLKRHPSSPEGQGSYQRLNTEILDLKTRKPAIERRITDLERQQTWISKRKSHKHHKEAEREQIIQALKQSRHLAQKAEMELTRSKACLAKLKEIHLLKSSPETLKKIFHNMPLHLTFFQPRRKKNDRLEKYCRLVARAIDGDWPRLYRALPFYPARGQETVAADIDDVTCRFLRSTQEQAHQALSRWRRMHTHACVNDMRSALSCIKRKDILEKIEPSSHPRLKAPISRIGPRVVHFPHISLGAKQKHNYLYF